jgi:pimeloyl-ACP methyl ester carboxylesterase
MTSIPHYERGFTLNRRRLVGAVPVAGATAALAAAGWSGATAAATPFVSAPASLPIPQQASAKEGIAKLPEVDLFFWDTGGNGQVVVLFHPWTGSALVWPYQQPALVKAGYRVISYSRRGFHNSDRGPEDRPGTGAGDLELLLSSLKVDRFHAVSTAAGAYVALDFALSHPERLHSLVLSCSILNVHGGAYDVLSKNLEVPGFSAMPAHFRELSPSYRAANLEGTTAWRELEAKSVVGKHVEQGFENKVSLASLANLRPRTLLIYGEADLIAPPPIGRLFAKAIPDSRLELLPECGHSAYWERPDLFNRAILEFIGREAA